MSHYCSGSFLSFWLFLINSFWPSPLKTKVQRSKFYVFKFKKKKRKDYFDLSKDFLNESSNCDLADRYTGTCYNLLILNNKLNIEINALFNIHFDCKV